MELVSVGVPEQLAAVEAQLVAPGSPFELVAETMHGETMWVPKQRAATLREVLLKSVDYGEREYLIATDGATTRRFTFAQHARLVASTASVFAEEFGVGKGDRVAILGANSPEWIVAFWATVSLGAIAVGLNGWWSGPEIERGIADCDPKLLVIDEKRLARLVDRTVAVPTIVMERDGAAIADAAPAAQFSDTPLDPGDPAIILYTSGTTGFPKGAVHTHGNLGWLLAMIYWHGARSMMTSPPPADSAPTCLFVTSPLFHVSGLHTGAVAYLASGTKSVWWQGRFDVLSTAAVLEREGCTGWSITETVLHRFVNHPEIERFDLSRVRSIGGGGSAISPSLQARARQVFPNAAASIGLGYGMTECTAWATTNFGQELVDFPLSCGRPLAGVALEIRDPDDIDGDALGEGTEGEVCIRSAGVMLEYWRQPEATADAIRPGRWLRTGDIGIIEGGRLYLASRKRDLILRGGENIHPIEIEQRLGDHPDVFECAVFGVDDPEFGQAVKAVVVARDGATLDTDELSEWVGGGLAYYKVPSHWDVRTTPLPRNATGKVVKDALRAGEAAHFVEE